jgi:cytochrome c biogenesis protein CcmG/thiol:disulfide interchange protein DsbE
MVESGLETRQAAPEAAPRRSTTRLLVAGAAFAIVAGLALLLGVGLSRRSDGTGATTTGTGRTAPNFVLPAFSGGELSLAQFAGKPVFIYFWASWCVPCRDEAPALEAAWRQYRDQGVAIVGVNVQDTEESARDFIREFNLTYPSVRDADGRVYIDYGVYGVPEGFFVGADGTIEKRWIGPLDAEQLDAGIKELIAR